MEAAKAAVAKHLGGSGKHTTTHHESVAPAVQHETVNPTRHENVTTAVDREVHQDHYHTSVQPIHDKETLPEVHRHNVAPVQHTQHEHDNADFNTKTLQTEAAKYKDQQIIADTVNTQAVAPTVGGEHVHHHVHETVQPVVHKTTIQPEVVHTTVPVHEVHHNAAQHHGAVQLPAMSMKDYTESGRILGGSTGERTEHFQGEPHQIAALAPVFGKEGVSHGEQVRDPDHAGAVSHARDPANTQHTEATREGNLNSGLSHTDKGLSSTTTGQSQATTGTTKKASLLDKLNPKIDADGDGKAGFMS